MTQAGTDFERLVVDFCKTNWGSEFVMENRYQGKSELDILIENNDRTIFIACTTERGKKKAEHDIERIREFRKLKFGDHVPKPISGYFVTQHDPSPDVHKVAEDNGSWIEACSFPAFVNKFNASRTYLNEREKRPFGSVRNPADDTIDIDRSQYVKVPFHVVASGQELSLESIIRDICLKQRTRLIATGDFGIGKSMTFRELFYRLSEKHRNGETYRFPLYINLSDTSFDDGDDVVDLIERHAKWVGLRDQRDKLVHAWTTDCCIILLDGFDELIRSGFTSLTSSSRDIRFASSHIVRTVVSTSPRNTPILISGRESYFSDFKEMKECLGAKAFSHISLQDLQEREVKELFRKIIPVGFTPIIFDWLPQRPLLLSYLYFELGPNIGLESELIAPLSPGDGWNRLLDRQSSRETFVARGAEPDRIRRLIERIALLARTNIADHGRATSLHITQAYRDVFEMEPDISVQQVLMRLPGLTSGHTNESRSFIDEAIFSAAQAGTIVNAIEILSTRDKAYIELDSNRRILDCLRSTRNSVSAICAYTVIARLKRSNSLSLIGVAIFEIMSNYPSLSGNLLADLLLCASQDPDVTLKETVKRLIIKGAVIPELDIHPGLIERVSIRFEDCVIDALEIGVDGDGLNKISFERTRIGKLSCSSELSRSLSRIGIQNGEAESCQIFDATNSDILGLKISNEFKAIKICLRKLFRQSGSGRNRGSFFRGIGDLDTRLIERCLGVLAKHSLTYVVGNATSANSTWHSNKAHSKRANFIIDSIAEPDDVVVRSLID